MHQQGSSDNKSCKDKSGCNPIGDFLKPFDECFFFAVIDLYLKFIFCQCVENMIDPSGHLADKFLCFYHRGKDISRGKTFFESLTGNFRGILPDRLVRFELRIKRSSDNIEIQKRLAYHG